MSSLTALLLRIDIAVALPVMSVESARPSSTTGAAVVASSVAELMVPVSVEVAFKSQRTLCAGATVVALEMLSEIVARGAQEEVLN